MSRISCAHISTITGLHPCIWHHGVQCLTLMFTCLPQVLALYNSGIYFVFTWQACCVEYIILESDNLSSLFPNAHLNIGGMHLNSHLVFALLTTIVVLPTTLLRDLSILSYISGSNALQLIRIFWVQIQWCNALPIIWLVWWSSLYIYGRKLTKFSIHWEKS